MFYYEKNLDPLLQSPTRIHELMEKAMEQVCCKENYNVFLKHLLVCDLALGDAFLEQVLTHYDMNSKPKMLIEKLQLLVTSCVSSEQKVKWL
jgi:hypothetical protein